MARLHEKQPDEAAENDPLILDHRPEMALKIAAQLRETEEAKLHLLETQKAAAPPEAVPAIDEEIARERATLASLAALEEKAKNDLRTLN